MIVEYLLADEDGTWSTRAFQLPEIPEDDRITMAGDDEATLGKWAREHLSEQPQYRRIVVWAVYGVYSDDRFEGPVYDAQSRRIEDTPPPSEDTPPAPGAGRP